MKNLETKKAPVRGTIYSGRCAGGVFDGAEVLMIAADDEALAAAWEALQRVELKTEMVYDVSVISTKRLNDLLDGRVAPDAELHHLDVE